jgi:general secretion pathway protein J
MKQSPVRVTGFTLLEVLVAIAIVAVVAAVGHISLVQTLRAQAGAAEAVARLAGMQRGLLRLNDELGSAVTRGVRTRAGFKTAAFVAGPSAVEFTTAASDPTDVPAGSSHMRRVRYVLDGGRFRREYWHVLDRAGDSQPTDSGEVLASMRDVRLRYLSADRRWVDQWPDGEEDGLPVAVELTATLEPGGTLRRLWRVGGQ